MKGDTWELKGREREDPNESSEKLQRNNAETHAARREISISLHQRKSQLVSKRQKSRP